MIEHIRLAQALHLIMPEVSRALRRRDYAAARACLEKVFDDEADVLAALLVLIDTEPKSGPSGPE